MMSGIKNDVQCVYIINFLKTWLWLFLRKDRYFINYNKYLDERRKKRDKDKKNNSLIKWNKYRLINELVDFDKLWDKNSKYALRRTCLKKEMSKFTKKYDTPKKNIIEEDVIKFKKKLLEELGKITDNKLYKQHVTKSKWVEYRKFNNYEYNIY